MQGNCAEPPDASLRQRDSISPPMCLVVTPAPFLSIFPRNNPDQQVGLWLNNLWIRPQADASAPRLQSVFPGRRRLTNAGAPQTSSTSIAAAAPAAIEMAWQSGMLWLTNSVLRQDASSTAMRALHLTDGSEVCLQGALCDERFEIAADGYLAALLSHRVYLLAMLEFWMRTMHMHTASTYTQRDARSADYFSRAELMTGALQRSS